MIHLNPVRESNDKVERGMIPTIEDLERMTTYEDFKEILLTDALNEEGQEKVAKYFKVENQWNDLLLSWKEKKTEVTGFRRYFELLFLVKAESKCNEVWFSFFKGMHQHATIVAGLLCSKFNYITNELELRNIDVE